VQKTDSQTPPAQQAESSRPESAEVEFGGVVPQEVLPGIETGLAGVEEEAVPAATTGLESLLAQNQQRVEQLQAELPRRVPNRDTRTFCELVSRIYLMEINEMERCQEDSEQEPAAPLLQPKDMEMEALRLQIQMRDRMIEDQAQLLSGQRPPKPDGIVWHASNHS